MGLESMDSIVVELELVLYAFETADSNRGRVDSLDISPWASYGGDNE
jgi:hypothetical protein